MTSSSQQKLLPVPDALIGAAESVLFAAGDPVLISELQDGLRIEAAQIEEVIAALEVRYSQKDCGVTLIKTDATLQLVSKPENHDAVARVLGIDKKRTLSRAAVEVLAIVAYRQPVTRVEIDKIRGVRSAGAIERLCDQALIQTCGRLDVPGRPHLYETTETFLRLAGIASLKELPEYDTFNEKA